MLVGDRGASASKARVLALSSRFRMLKGDNEQAIRVAQEALGLAEGLELDELRAHALTTIGSSKSRIELASGRAEIEQALEIALAADSPIAAVTLNNLAGLAIWEGDWLRAYELYPQAERSRNASATETGFASAWESNSSRRGAGALGRGARRGRRVCGGMRGVPHYAEGIVREARASIRLARGDLAGAAEDREWTLQQAHRIKDPQRLLPTLAATAVGLVLLDREDEARTVAEETIAVAREHVDLTGATNHLLLVAGRLGLATSSAASSC